MLLVAAASLVLLPAGLEILPRCGAITAFVGPLVLLNLASSCEPHAGILTAARWSLLAILGLCLVALVRSGARIALAWTGVLAGSAAALVALWQGMSGHARMAERLAEAPLSMREAALARLGSGRVNGPFLLPASLAGGLAVTLPLTVALIVMSRTRRMKALGAGLATLQLAALLWTVSLGGWAALTISATLVLSSRWLRTPRGRMKLASGIVLGAIAVAGGLFVRRTLLPPAGPPDRPLGYRAGNWQVSVRILADHPLLGTGLGTFGDVFPGYRAEGMNESRYAHCTWLQIPAEMGVPTIPLLGLVLVAALVLVRRTRDDGPLIQAGTIGVVAFLVHNAVDFTAYQPSVAALFGLALAMATHSRRESSRSEPGEGFEIDGHAQESRGREADARTVHEGGDPSDPLSPPETLSPGSSPRPVTRLRKSEMTSPAFTDPREEPRGSWGRHTGGMGRRSGIPWIVAMTVSAAAASALVASSLSDLATDRAAAMHGSDPDAERTALAHAIRFDPLDAAPHGYLALALADRARSDLGSAETEARRAISLDTRTAFRHRDLALILLKEGKTSEAWIELSKASTLYPLKSEYKEDMNRIERDLFPSKSSVGP